MEEVYAFDLQTPQEKMGAEEEGGVGSLQSVPATKLKGTPDGENVCDSQKVIFCNGKSQG